MQRLTPYGPITSLVPHPPQALPYFTSTTILQSDPHSKTFLHSHFLKKDLIKAYRIPDTFEEVYKS